MSILSLSRPDAIAPALSERLSVSEKKLLFAVPLRVYDSPLKLSLVFDETTYQVIKSPFHLQGLVEEDVVTVCNAIESSFPKIEFGDEPPTWHKEFNPASIVWSNLVADINSWFLDPANQTARKTENPKMLELVGPEGPRNVGPKYLAGTQEELGKIMRGICAWFVAETKAYYPNDDGKTNEMHTGDPVITVTGPTDPEGSMEVSIFPDNIPAVQATTLAKIAFLSNRFYGYEWQRDPKDTRNEAYLQQHWKRHPLDLKFIAPKNESEAETHRAFIVQWAKTKGIDLTQTRR